MSAEFRPEKKPLNFWIIVFLIIIIGLVLFCVYPTNERAFVSSNLARIRANILLQKIPLPEGMEELASWGDVTIYNSECYMGGANILAGTHLDIDTVGSFYETFFANWNWKFINDLHTKSLYSHPNFFASNNRLIEGVRVDYCDQTCLSYVDVPPTVVQAAQEEYENLYVIWTWYYPIESRTGFCANTGW